MSQEVVSIYTDGSVLHHNPSDLGGPWAWCGIDKEGDMVISGSGIIKGPCTNNHSEFMAVVMALEAMPDGWGGTVYCDSYITISRLWYGATLSGIPMDLVLRGGAALRRTKSTGVLVAGHPSKAHLAAGHKNGTPVSEWNVWCDKRCTEVGREYEARLRARQEALANVI